MHIVSLRKEHERGAFDCGVASLNVFLKQRARRNAEAGFSATYVLLEEGTPRILAYYTIAAGQFACRELPDNLGKRLPKHPVPVLRLCRLATDLTRRGQGLGEIMLVDALHRAVMISTELGIHAVEVDALSAQARSFCQRYGFRSLRDDVNHLYLPVASIRDWEAQGRGI
jgi:predicted GNAT family N-acyltransferase